MEKREWRIKYTDELERLMHELREDGYVVDLNHRFSGKFLAVETEPENWPHVQGLVDQLAPSATSSD